MQIEHLTFKLWAKPEAHEDARIYVTQTHNNKQIGYVSMDGEWHTARNFTTGIAIDWLEEMGLWTGDKMSFKGTAMAIVELFFPKPVEIEATSGAVYTITTTKNDLSNLYGEFQFDFVSQDETTEVHTCTTDNGSALELLLNADNDVISYMTSETLTLTLAEEVKDELAKKMAIVSHEAYDADAQGHWFIGDFDRDGELETLFEGKCPYVDMVYVPIEDCFLGREDGYDLSWNCDCSGCPEDGCEGAESASSFCMDTLRKEVEHEN